VTLLETNINQLHSISATRKLSKSEQVNIEIEDFCKFFSTSDLVYLLLFSLLSTFLSCFYKLNQYQIITATKIMDKISMTSTNEDPAQLKSSPRLSVRKCSSENLIGQNSASKKSMFKRFRSDSVFTSSTSLFNDQSLVGDFSRKFILPIVEEEKASSVTKISPETLRNLLEGRFNDLISSFKVVDCRFPYEYRGGHIRGSINLHNEEIIVNELLKKSSTRLQKFDEEKREILIFHCEFSSKRAPRL
jgi:hypothetical protein